MFPEDMVRGMREELTRVGFREMRTPTEVDAVLKQEKRTVLVVVNSVCGCAAGKARPAIAKALANKARPEILATVFAGQDREATEQARTTCMPRHRHQEWLRFLRLIDRKTPSGKQLHLIVDNYATHKHPAVQAWTERHPRFHFHFTPTASSWLNMIERFFRDLTENQLRRGVFCSVDDLEAAINNYIDMHNKKPKPFIWTAKATDILEKVKRGRAALNNNTTA